MLCHKSDEEHDLPGFYVGYSPERVNPGDKDRGIPDIVKVTSASTKVSARKVVEVYGEVVSAGIYEAPSIQVAEAAKVIENTQRDVNIALVNELSLNFCQDEYLDYRSIEAASTKMEFFEFCSWISWWTLHRWTPFIWLINQDC